jgi:hypothetical protein
MCASPPKDELSPERPLVSMDFGGVRNCVPTQAAIRHADVTVQIVRETLADGHDLPDERTRVRTESVRGRH